MKKLLIIFTGLMGLLFSLATFAQEKNGDQQIIMYSKPNAQTIVEKLPGDAALVPIFQNKKWVKVGDPANGNVGWVNKKQLRKAREAFYRPDIQTIYIHSDQSSNGKPQLNIVAYKNGQKLSQEQAQRLYEKVRKQQMHEMKHMRRMFDHELISMRQSFQMMPVFQPMIVLPASTAQRMQPLRKPAAPKAKKNDELES